MTALTSPLAGGYVTESTDLSQRHLSDPGRPTGRGGKNGDFNLLII